MYKWTVIYLMECEADGVQPAAAQSMFNELLLLRKSDQVGIVLCLKTTLNVIQTIDPGHAGLATVGADDAVIMFYKIEALDEPGNGMNSRLIQIAPDSTVFDLIKGADLQTFFTQTVLQQFTAENYLLFTWGHGAGAGIFLHAALPSPGQRWPLLSIDDLAATISASFVKAGARVNIVVMMNCFMQHMDAAYALYGAGVRYLAASEFGADFYGYDYTAIFTRLYSNPSIADKDLAEWVVASLRSAPRRLQQKLFIAAFFTADLSVVPELADAIGKLADRLLTLLSTEPEKINAARKRCNYIIRGYSETDLLLFIKRLQKELGRSWEVEAVKGVQASVSKLIRASYFGWTLRLMNKWALGLAMSLPNQPSTRYVDNFIDPRSPFATSFSKLSSWSRFAMAYAHYLEANPDKKKGRS